MHAPKSSMAMPLSNPFASTTLPTTPRPLHRALVPLLAAAGEDGSQEPPPAAKTATDDAFEERVLRIKSRVGPKKRGGAARKKKGAGAGAAVTLPPVPLRESRSAVGVPVEIGFTPYSERLNGALAGVGLAALLLVELGSGQALVKYHAPATLFLQAYTIAAAGALFVKYEKERISVWPEKPAAKPKANRE